MLFGGSLWRVERARALTLVCLGMARSWSSCSTMGQDLWRGRREVGVEVGVDVCRAGQSQSRCDIGLKMLHTEMTRLASTTDWSISCST
jgi:hypothetical protein